MDASIRNLLVKIMVWAAPSLATLAIISLAPGCGEEDLAGPPHHHANPAGVLVRHTDCKKSQNVSASSEAVPIMDCVEYQFLDGDTLLLTHVNAGFNCCPGEITADITIRNDTIRIVERESSPMCHCLCLYDLVYRIDNLPAGMYTFEFVEPYVTDADPPLRFTADLASTPSDTFCAGRCCYPWNTGGTTEPFGVLVSRTDCHSGSYVSYADDRMPGDLSCVEWKYGASYILRLMHVNAGFNCCPGEITADITIANGIITIAEHEEQSLCDCSCLYDLVFEIRNLQPMVYTIRFIEPYVQPEDERLEFSVDLTNVHLGIAYAYRSRYPWMYQSTMPEDKAVLDWMRREIIALIGTPSCGGTDDCRYIGLGVKPCGGFWGYLIYSTSTVNEDILRYRVCRYNAFNYGFNRRYDIASDCMYVLPPRVGCIEGVCADLDAAK